VDPDISTQIVQLRAFSREQLLELWQKLYRRPAPHGIRRELMVPFLAYRIQENAYGGLKPSTRSELRRIARDLKKSTASPEVRIRPKIKSGTRILRQWRGETHEVVVTESGYEYRESGYHSLSEIARKITGVRWSGPAFFRLNTVRSPRGRSDD
jgi:Protein of unknown function (DUF2924)